ncbi:MAG TPA: hypothetical protein PKV27_06680, partial [Ilumatobacteraceae bacterium]|nr:hypothetical protein [Ilumatobacteraceae bacterium]
MDDSALAVVAVTPSPGWVVKPILRQSANALSIVLVGRSYALQFSAKLIGGVVATSIVRLALDETIDVSTPMATPPSLAGGPNSSPSRTTEILGDPASTTASSSLPAV